MDHTQLLIAEIVLAVVCAAAASFFMFIRVTKKPIWGLLTKTLASMCFVAMGGIALLLGSYSGHSVPFGAQLFVVGLAFGMVGDIVLDLKRAHSEFEDIYLFSGMTAFSFGHFANIAATCLIASGIGSGSYVASIMKVNLLVPALASLAIAVCAAPIIIFVSEKFLKNVFGKFRNISGFYAGLLVFFTVFSLWLTILNTNYLLLLLGMIMFLISDLVLSTMYFVAGKKEDKMLVIINHATYYAAQILICCFIFSLIH